MATETPSKPIPPESTENLDITTPDAVVDSRLSQTRRQLRSVDLMAGLLWLACAAIGWFLIAAVMDHWLFDEGLSSFGRWMMLLLFLVGGAVFSFFRIIRPLMRPVNSVYIAHRIEQTNASAKNSLINFLMLRRTKETVESSVFGAMSERAADDIQRVAPEEAIDWGGVLRIAYLFTALVAIGAIYQLLSPKSPFTSAARIAAPWSDRAAPTRVAFNEITPGNLTTYYGERTPVSAEVIGLHDGEMPTLYYTTADGQTVNHPVPMSRPEGDYRYQCTIPPEPEGFQQDVAYYLAAGDGRSPTFRITARAPPAIAVETVQYNYPGYTRQPPKTVTDSADVIAIEGTQVTVQAKANREIRRADIDLGCDHLRLIPMKVDDRTATGTWSLRQESDPKRVAEQQSYQLIFVDSQGKENPSPIRHTIRVIPDRVPTVQLIDPPGDAIELPVNGRLELTVAAEDPDFGLRSVQLRAEREGRGLAIPPMLRVATDASEWQKTYQGSITLEPQMLDLKPGDEIEYWVEAKDVKTPNANVAQTERRRLLIVEEASNDQKAEEQKNPEQQGEEQQNNQGGQQGEDQQNDQGGQQGEDQQNDQGGQKGEDQQNDQGGQKGEDQQNNQGGQKGEDQQNNQNGQQGEGQQQPGQKGEDQQNNQGGQQGEGQQQPGQKGDGQKQPGGGQKQDGESQGQTERRQGNAENGQQKDGQPGQSGTETQDQFGQGQETQPNEGDAQSESGQKGQQSPRDASGQKSDNQKPDKPIDGQANPGDVFEEALKRAEKWDSGQPKDGAPSPEGKPDKTPGEGDQQRPTDDQKNGKPGESKPKTDDFGQPIEKQPTDEQDGKIGTGSDDGKKKPTDEQTDQGKPSEDQQGKGDEQKSTGKDDHDAGQPKSEGKLKPTDQDQGEIQEGTGQDKGTHIPDDHEQPSGNQTDGPGKGGKPLDGQPPEDAQTVSPGDQPPTGETRPHGKSTDESVNQPSPDMLEDKQPGEEGKAPSEIKSPTGEVPSDSEPGDKMAGGTGLGSDISKPPKSESVGADPFDKEAADKKTALALEYLKDQLAKEKPDQDLLDSLGGWSRDDLDDFVRRWEKMRNAAKQAERSNQDATRRYEEALRSLGLPTGRSELKARTESHRVENVRQSRQSTPPSSWRDRINAYQRSIGK